MSEEKVVNVETEIVAKDGRKIIVEGNVICRFFKGNPLYTQCFLRDVTERKRMDEEIKTRMKELEDFYEIAVGREVRMKELKEEIEKLRKELTQYKKDQEGDS